MILQPGDDGAFAQELLEQAQTFAHDLTKTIQAVAGPGCSPFQATAIPGAAGGAFGVSQSPATGVALRVDGVPLLTLTAEYHCVWDHARQYLAVESSQIKVYPGPQARREPLFRYEYLRRPDGDIAGAHLQVHGHHDALAFVMTRSGRSTTRGKSLAKKAEKGLEVPRMSDLHLPLGGGRFRPCLEDVVDMLIRELGVDAQEAWRDALERGREQWRRYQIGAVVRDAPSTAIETLRMMGYDVSWPSDDETEPVDRPGRLRDL